MKPYIKFFKHKRDEGVTFWIRFIGVEEYGFVMSPIRCCNSSIMSIPACIVACHNISIKPEL